MSARTAREWSGVDVTISAVDAELAHLRRETVGDDGQPHQRTSVMTHIAWVPPDWVEAAERTLEGLGERHPSRTVILVPIPDEPDGIDARLSVRSFPVGDRAVSSEVIELTLRGERSCAPASVVLPLTISDLPVFLRWRGEPLFGETQWEQLVGVADRVIVDSSEWAEPPLPRARGRLRADRRLRYRLGAHRRVADLAGGSLAGDREPGDRS